uniref:PPM-type phosphatase domain-containing protein n=1 Tax=Caenorhabditis tropicalis TaxID=1561998 RepID=A0A1I7TT57_9PELO
MKHLKVIDLSHNLLNSFDDSALSSLELLEELNLSSNRLTRLTDCLALLPCLQVLRAHSNLLVHIPDLQRASQLHTIDLSSNNISLGTLQFKAPPSLRHFDVTCNSGDFNTKNFPDESNSKMNTVDISEGPQNVFGFQIGMSGSRGMKNKQCVRQIRVDNTFGFVDGGSNSYMSSSICRFLISILRENASKDIRSILLRCHCELGDEGERLGASVMIVRLHERRLEIASTGTISAAVAVNQSLKTIINGRYEIDEDEYSRIREARGFVDEENCINGVIGSSRQIGHFSTFPVVLPTHSYKNIVLSEEIEGFLIANSMVWNMLSMDDLNLAFHNNRSPIVVAKKIQDRLQSFDYGGNSNILVLRRMKPQMTFNGFPSSNQWKKTDNGSSSTLLTTVPKIDEQLVLAVPALILPEYHHPTTSAHPIPATRHRTPSPQPPPLPLSTPPPVSSEMEEINLHQSVSSSGYSFSNDRFYASSSTVSSRKQFNETRDLLSKSLKFSPPSAVTFNI